MTKNTTVPVKGGSWIYDAWNYQSAICNDKPRDFSYFSGSFRIVLRRKAND